MSDLTEQEIRSWIEGTRLELLAEKGSPSGWAGAMHMALGLMEQLLAARGEETRGEGRTAPNSAENYADALECTDTALRALLAGEPVRDADAILARNAWLLFAEPTVTAHPP